MKCLMKTEDYKVIDNGLWISVKELNRLLKENLKLRNDSPDWQIKKNWMHQGAEYIWWNPWNRHLNGRIGILQELKKKYDENRSKTKNG